MRLILTTAIFLSAVHIFAQETTGQIDSEARESRSSILSATSADPALILVCPLVGLIDDGLVEIAGRALDEAKDSDASTLIFRVDTHGGRVDSAVRITNAIERAEFRTVAYIEGMGAISIGALIGYACDDMIMARGSNIGASSPVIPDSSGSQTINRKEISFLRAKMRALAESNGHNPDIAQAMIDGEIELRRRNDDVRVYVIYAANLDGGRQEDIGIRSGDEVVLPRGTRLTLTPEQAEEYRVTLGTVENLNEAVSLLELGSNPFIVREVDLDRTYAASPNSMDDPGTWGRKNRSMRNMATLFLAAPILGFVLFVIGGLTSAFTSRPKIWFSVAAALGLLAVVIGAAAFWMEAWTIGISGTESASEFPAVWAWFFLGVFCSISSVLCLLAGFRRRTTAT